MKKPPALSPKRSSNRIKLLKYPGRTFPHPIRYKLMLYADRTGL